MIYTFYSYKGGVGRSMALANIAEWFYLQKKRVVMIDWDLEAPGLEGYFFQGEQLEKIKSRKGLIDILQTYKLQYKKNFAELSKSRLETQITINKICSAVVERETDYEQLTGLLRTFALFKREDLANIIAELEAIPSIDISIVEDILKKKITDEKMLDKITLAINDKLREDSQDLTQIKVYLSCFCLLKEESFAPIISKIKELQKNARLNEASVLSLLAQYLATTDPDSLSAEVFNNENIKDVLYEVHPGDPDQKSGLWMLTAGRRDAEYFTKYSATVQDFSWTDFYNLYNGEAYFKKLQVALEDFADIILIDSRTGVSEMSGVSTRQLADVIVIFTAPNHQNLAGTHSMIKSFTNEEVLKIRGDRSLKIVVVPSRVDSSEIAERNKFEANFYRTINEVVGTGLSIDFWKLGIPYVPRYLYNEELAIGTSTDPDQLEVSTKAAELDEAYKKIGLYLLKNEKFDQEAIQQTPDAVAKSPFPGLRAYQINDSSFFFGRNTEINHVAGFIKKNRAIIISGPAGSGKTSFIQAGLIPALEKDKRNNLPFIFYTFEDRYSHIAAELEDKKGILIVDQAEILFINNEEKEIQAFINTISLWLYENDTNRILISVRTEYLDKLIGSLSFINESDIQQINLGNLGDTELRQIIQESARRTHLKFEPGLIERILKDSEKLPAKLPLIQYTLNELWQNRQLNILTHVAYDRMGQLEGATQAFLKNNLSSIPLSDLSSIKSIITRLVNSESKTRVSVNLNDFTAEQIFKLKPLIDAGLVTITTNIKESIQTIQLSHDSLIKNWPVLNDWLNEDSEFLKWRQGLDYRIIEWENRYQNSSYLLNDDLLTEGFKWSTRRPADLSEKEISFINQSEKQRKNNIDKQLKFLKRTRVMQILLVCIMVLSVGIAIFTAINTSSKKRKLIAQFNAQLSAIDFKFGKEKQDAICNLAIFNNYYDDDFINHKKDSLLAQCIQIRSMVNTTDVIIDSNQRKVDTLSAIALDPKNLQLSNKLKRIDSLDRILDSVKMKLLYTKNPGSKIILQNDSARFHAEITNIVKNDSFLTTARAVGSKIQESIKKQNAVMENKSPEILFQQSTWVKRNYFLQFDSIKVLCIDLSKSNQTVTVQICNIVGSDVCTLPIVNPDPTISLNNALNFNFGGYKYVINLDRIGSAGNNPFTPAAYITFQKIKKE